MNYKKDPIYKALNEEKPNKQKVLEAAYSEMPSVKPRKSFFKTKYAIAVILIVVLAALIPAFIYGYERYGNNYKGAPLNDQKNAAPAPDSTTEQSNNIKFNFNKIDYDNSMPNGAYRVIDSYINYNEGVAEQITVFFYNGNLPNNYNTIYINKLSTTGKYTVTPLSKLVRINLYFLYNNTSYLIQIDCTEESRLAYFISEIII